MLNSAAKPLTYTLRARRIDALGSEASCKEARITLDTALAGRSDAFNPAELLLAALAACMIKGIERVAPIIHFGFRGVEVRLSGLRQDSPPKMARIDYEIVVDTDEAERKLELLHENVRRYGTVFNTVASGTTLAGTLRRRTEGD
ncbi:MAG: OsmC family protein [Burkholderiales bacterium]